MRTGRLAPHTRRTAYGLLTLGATAAILAGCGASTLDAGKLQNEIATEVQKLVPEGTEVSVTCPSGVAIEAGATFDCTMDVAGQSATIVVTQEDAEGNVAFESKSAIIYLDQTQAEITKEVVAQAPGTWTTTCTPPGSNANVYLAEPGTTFDCVVAGTFEDGEATEATATVTVEDNAGNISFVVD
jgi:hypothetical protein